MTEEEIDQAWEDRQIAELKGAVETLMAELRSSKAANHALNTLNHVLRKDLVEANARIAKLQAVVDAARPYVIGTDGSTLHADEMCHKHPANYYKDYPDRYVCHCGAEEIRKAMDALESES